MIAVCPRYFFGFENGPVWNFRCHIISWFSWWIISFHWTKHHGPRLRQRAHGVQQRFGPDNLNTLGAISRCLDEFYWDEDPIRSINPSDFGVENQHLSKRKTHWGLPMCWRIEVSTKRRHWSREDLIPTVLFVLPHCFLLFLLPFFIPYFSCFFPPFFLPYFSSLFFIPYFYPSSSLCAFPFSHVLLMFFPSFPSLLFFLVLPYVPFLFYLFFPSFPSLFLFTYLSIPIFLPYFYSLLFFCIFLSYSYSVFSFLIFLPYFYFTCFLLYFLPYFSLLVFLRIFLSYFFPLLSLPFTFPYFFYFFPGFPSGFYSLFLLLYFLYCVFSSILSSLFFFPIWVPMLALFDFRFSNIFSTFFFFCSNGN